MTSEIYIEELDLLGRSFYWQKRVGIDTLAAFAGRLLDIERNRKIDFCMQAV